MTPYEHIDTKDLYAMIDHFYNLVKQDDRINHLFPNDFSETSRKQKQFLTQFLGGPALYTEEHGHPMLRQRHLPFKISEIERDAWLENMYVALKASNINQDIAIFLFERLKLTANHMVNA